MEQNIAHTYFPWLYVHVHKVLNSVMWDYFPCLFLENLRGEIKDMQGANRGGVRKTGYDQGRTDRKCCVLVKCDIVTFKWLNFLCVSVSVCVWMWVQPVNCPIAPQPTWLKLHSVQLKHFPLISRRGDWKRRVKTGSRSAIAVANRATQLNQAVCCNSWQIRTPSFLPVLKSCSDVMQAERSRPGWLLPNSDFWYVLFLDIRVPSWKKKIIICNVS